ncbi:hypothetical protein Tco_1316071 [Tanacetum coccineum]
MDSEVVKGGKDKAECSKTIAQECSERAGDELEQERIKKQKIDDDQEEAEMKKPEKAYERVLWGDLKVMFEPDIESEVWRNLQGHKLTV